MHQRHHTDQLPSVRVVPEAHNSVHERLVFLDAKMSSDAARTLLSFKFAKEDERRMNRLAAKARLGSLTEREQAAAEQYNLVSHLLALLQAKARHTLKVRSPDSATA